MEITVTNQQEFNAIAEDFEGEINVRTIEGITIKREFSKATINLRGSSHAVLWGSSRAVLRESSHAELWGSSRAVLRESSHAELRESSHAVLWESSHAELRDSSRAMLYSYSVCWVYSDRANAQQKSSHAVIQIPEPEPYLEREGIEIVDGTVILFKRVSRDWKTQEGTSRETTWKPGVIVEHPHWQPELEECGAGKYHACSRSYFADEFRDKEMDRYVAIKIAVDDLYEWPSPQYSHKTAFRKGEVLYEVNRWGEKIEHD